MGRPKSKSELTSINCCLGPQAHASIEQIAQSIWLPPSPAGFTQAHTYMTSLVLLWWSAAMLWVAYYMQPSIDVTRRPFHHKFIKQARPLGDFCHQWLVLTRECWENDSLFRHLFQNRGTPSPLHVWTQAMIDFKISQVHGAFKHTETPGQSHRKFFKKLKRDLAFHGREKFTDETLILNKILVSAQRIRKKTSCHEKFDRFCNLAWEPFLASLGAYGRVYARDNGFISCSKDGQKIERRDGARLTDFTPGPQVMNPTLTKPPLYTLKMTQVVDGQRYTVSYSLPQGGWGAAEVYRLP